jgi:hypothetical protein
MCLIVYKLIIWFLSTYVYLLVIFLFNSLVCNVSNCMLLNNYMVLMMKFFSDMVLSMKTFSHVIIHMVIKIHLGTKICHIRLHE